jgi:hypothetical protein
MRPRRERRDPSVHRKADEREELADEAQKSRQPDIGQREHHEGRGIERRAVDEAAIGRDLARMHAVVDHPDAKEQRRRRAVRIIWKIPPATPWWRRISHGDEAHMRHGGIGDGFFMSSCTSATSEV